jgi:hypothetical protein
VLLPSLYLIAGVLHDDLHVGSFSGRRVATAHAAQFNGDFTKNFGVNSHSRPPWCDANHPPSNGELRLSCEPSGFRRGLHVRLETPGLAPTIVGSLVAIAFVLAPSTERGSSPALASEMILDVCLSPVTGIALNRDPIGNTFHLTSPVDLMAWTVQMFGKQSKKRSSGSSVLLQTSDNSTKGRRLAMNARSPSAALDCEHAGGRLSSLTSVLSADYYSYAALSSRIVN